VPRRQEGRREKGGGERERVGGRERERGGKREKHRYRARESVCGRESETSRSLDMKALNFFSSSSPSISIPNEDTPDKCADLFGCALFGMWVSLVYMCCLCVLLMHIGSVLSAHIC